MEEANDYVTNYFDNGELDDSEDNLDEGNVF
jgi:hypothetical protein